MNVRLLAGQGTQGGYRWLSCLRDPVALGVADLDGDKTPEILYITKDRDGATTNDLFTLRALAQEKTGKFIPYRWGTVDSVPLKGIGGVPPAITVVDVNRDGLPDMLVFDVYGPPMLLLGRPGEPPAPAAGGLGPLAGVTPAGLSVTKLDGQQALIVAQQSFARKLLLDKGGHWTVQDQFDSGRTSAKIEGAAVIDTDGDGVPEIALLDRISKSILFLAKKEGTYVPSGSLSVGPFDDFKGMHVADLDGDGKEDLLLAGASRFGVVLTGQKGLKLKTLASYESPRNEARFGDLIIGDMNADGRPDVVLTDVIEHFIEIATFGEKSDLTSAFSFKIFERKSRRTPELEPRDLAIGDVDGDGRTDLILIAHDRVLVYRQDPGQSKEKEPVKAADKDPTRITGNAYVSILGQTSILNIKHALDLYQAETGEFPKAYEEFMEKIIKANNIALPKLPFYQEYGYDAPSHSLVIVEYPDRKKAAGYPE